jgi:hypothetical protein
MARVVALVVAAALGSWRNGLTGCRSGGCAWTARDNTKGECVWQRELSTDAREKTMEMGEMAGG